MKINNILIATMLFLTIGLAGCEKDNYEMIRELPTSQLLLTNSPSFDTTSIPKINNVIEQYSYLIASCMENSSFRSLIKEKAMERFDGDYDVLATTLHESYLPNGIKVIELLSSKYDSLFRINGEMTGNDFIQYAVLSVPNLQISVPLYCEEWNTLDFIPNVIPLPCDFRDSCDEILSYNSNLLPSAVSTRTKPEVPYVVVGMSERVDMNGNLKYVNQTSSYSHYQFPTDSTPASPDYPAMLTLNQGPAHQLILQWSDVANENGYLVYRKHMSGGFYPIDTLGANENMFMDTGLVGGDQYWYTVRSFNGGGLSPYSPIKTTWASNRNDNQSLVIKRIKFTSNELNDVESWVKGSPEIRIVLAHGTVDGTHANKMHNAVYEPSHRSDIEDCWWNCGILLSASWNLSSSGSCLTIFFAEDDVINITKYTLTTNYEDKLMTFNDTTSTTTNQGLGTIKFGGTFEFLSNDGSGQTEMKFWDATKTYQIGGITFEIE